MENSNKKYPGFIDGLKASNIANNRPSLEGLSKQIKDEINRLLLRQGITDIIKRRLESAISAISMTIDNDNSEDVLNNYIVFGNEILSLSQISDANDLNDYKAIVLAFLSIAKYSSDSRVKEISIALAKEFQKQ